MELILDYMVGAEVISSMLNKEGINLFSLCESKNIRLWLYTADFPKLKEEFSKNNPGLDLHEFINKTESIFWLPSLAQDIFADENARMLVKASSLLKNPIIATADESLLASCSYAFSKEEVVDKLNTIDSSIPFIDLKAQYARMQKDIEHNLMSSMYAGQFIRGQECGQLESELSGFCGAKHCIGVSSGTDALYIAMLALGIGPGDEIITTPFTFFATFETIKLLGAKPVFVDIEQDTYNIDAAKIEEKVTSRTKGIIPVSLYGQCADMDAINSIASKHNLYVIEDAAQSFGAKYNGKMSCNLSTVACTSFFPSKPLGGYGDGGACFTSDDEIAGKIRLLINHGQPKKYTHTEIGTNARLDTIQASMVRAKLPSFAKETELRQEVAARYNTALCEAVIVPAIAEGRTSAYAQYTILVENRDDVAAELKSKGVPTAIHYPIPLHKQPALQEEYVGESYPVAEKISRQVLSLPMHPYLTIEQQDYIIDAVLKSIN